MEGCVEGMWRGMWREWEGMGGGVHGNARFPRALAEVYLPHELPLLCALNAPAAARREGEIPFLPEYEIAAIQSTPVFRFIDDVKVQPPRNRRVLDRDRHPISSDPRPLTQFLHRSPTFTPPSRPTLPSPQCPSRLFSLTTTSLRRRFVFGRSAPGASSTCAHARGRGPQTSASTPGASRSFMPRSTWPSSGSVRLAGSRHPTESRDESAGAGGCGLGRGVDVRCGDDAVCVSSSKP